MDKYHRDHTWVKNEGEKSVIGLTYYAQAHLGKIVYLDLPPAGDQLKAGTVLGGIESEKTTSEIISPVSGLVLESNLNLETQPDLINDSPLDQGWITKVSLADPGELEGLMDFQAYEAYLSGLAEEE